MRINGVLAGPGQSLKVLEFENCPRKSLNVLIIMKNPGKVLAFYTVFAF